MSYGEIEVQRSLRDLSIPQDMSVNAVLMDVKAISVTNTAEELVALRRYLRAYQEYLKNCREIDRLYASMDGLEGEALERVEAAVEEVEERNEEAFQIYYELGHTGAMRDVYGRVSAVVCELNNSLYKQYPDYDDRFNAVVYYLQYMRAKPVSSRMQGHELMIRDVLLGVDARSLANTTEEQIALTRYRRIFREHREIAEMIEKNEGAMQEGEGEKLERLCVENDNARARLSELYDTICEMEGAAPLSSVITRINLVVANLIRKNALGLTLSEQLQEVEEYLQLWSSVRLGPPRDEKTAKRINATVKQLERRKNGTNGFVIGLLVFAAIIFGLYLFVSK